ncbi:MAG TPA: DUF5916 domain-containing protein [Gemmatimonadales bacterium]|jgi:hypothetical protein|nr:DUF5916 domain-containing protein [Gemmatimonadales bacterium]
MSPTRILLLCCLLLPGSLFGQGSSATSAVSATTRGVVHLGRFDAPPVIDGILDEPAWQTAARLEGFIQTEPGDNTAPTHPTVVMIGFDARSIYIGLVATDDSAQVRATIAARDAILNDDIITLFLDTFGDRKRAYVLAFNPLGIQQDGVYTEGTELPDYSVDLVMQSRGRVTATGWSVEAEIPLSSLRFSASPGQSWHLQVQRRIRHLNNELDSWMPLVRGDAAFLARAGTLSGIDQLPARRSVELIPSVTGLWAGERTPGAASGGPDAFRDQALNPDVGLSGRMGLSSGVSLDVAVNPDFAQVEADAPIVLANQRFPTKFPEKRPFFLEGLDLFQTPISVVHTRTIVDPMAAVKLTGTRGSTAFGLLLASDEAPGSFSDLERRDSSLQSQIDRLGGHNSSIAVLRARRETGAGSTVGLLGTGYHFVDRDNVTGGVDVRLAPNPRLVATAQLTGTWARRSFYDPETNQDVLRDGTGLGYYLSLRRTGRHFNTILTGSGRSPDYVSEVGFTAQVNTNVWSLETRWNSEQHADATLMSWSAAHTVLVQFDWQGRPTYGFLWPRLALNFPRLTTVTIGPYLDYNRIFEEEFGPKRGPGQAGAFFGAPSRETLYRGFAITGSSTPDRRWTIEESLDWSWDTFDYDFGDGPRFPRVSPAALADPNAPLDPGPGATFDASLTVAWTPVSAIRVDASYTRSQLRREDTGRFAYRENLWSGETVLQLGSFTFLRLRADYRSSRSNLRTQFLAAWTPNPGTAVYLGYDDDLNHEGYSPFSGIREPGWQRNARTLFVKLSWLFRKTLP